MISRMTQGRLVNIIFSLICLCFISSCSFTPKPAREITSIDQSQKILEQSIAIDKKKQKKSVYVPKHVQDALLPSTIVETSARSEQRFDISANNMSAKSFFMGLVEGTSKNMVLDPAISGNISLNLKNVTVEEAMDAVHDSYGYSYQRTSYGYEVHPPRIQSQIFNVNYIDVTRSGKSTTQMTSGQISEQINGTTTNNSLTGAQPSTQTVVNPISSIDTKSEMNFWKDLTGTLEAMVGKENGRSVVVNSQAGIVVVHAYPHELKQVAHYLDRMQSNIDREVIIEAKILEVALNSEFQSGIDWNLFGKGLINTATVQNDTGGMNQVSTNDFESANLQDFNGIFALNVKGNFGALIKLLQDQGNVQVLSSPRISTVNNQKAVIKVGTDEFFVTNVSSTTTVAGNATIPTQAVSLTPFFSGVTLDVTPQISSTGNVVLHIHPTVSLVKTQNKQVTVGSVANTSGGTVPNTLILPLALSDIRESDNIVRASNGQVVVIGGLMKNSMQENIAGTPIASQIPFVGALFRRTQQIATKSELVILLRPIIVTKKKWVDDLENTNDRFHELKRGFHVGGLPEVFGTEGERRDS